MKALVIGGTGLIGRQVVDMLRAEGHEAIPASPSSGVDAVTGEGLQEATAGVDVVIDLVNAPAFDEETAVAFFRASTGHLLEAEQAAGVRHHVALSIVGSDRVPATAYMAGKVAQEELIRGGGVPYTIVKATQFYEFLGVIADGSTVDGVVRLPRTQFQPIASADVARAVADAAVAPPAGGVVEVAGPERAPMADLIRRLLAARDDSREVIADPEATYLGIAAGEDGLVPVGDAIIAKTTLAEFLAR